MSKPVSADGYRLTIWFPERLKRRLLRAALRKSAAPGYKGKLSMGALIRELLDTHLP